MKNLNVKKLICCMIFIVFSNFPTNAQSISSSTQLDSCTALIEGGRSKWCCDTFFIDVTVQPHDTICLDSLLYGGNYGENIKLTNGKGHVEFTRDGDIKVEANDNVGLQTSSNGTSIDDYDGIMMGKVTNISDIARVVSNGWYNSSQPAFLIRNNYNNTPANSSAIGLKVLSKYTTGAGIGIRSEGGYKSIYAINDGSTSTGSTYGVQVQSIGSKGTRYALHASSNVNNATGNKFGVYGETVGTGSSGGHFAVYGKASGGATAWAGYFEGNVYCSGQYLPSDRKLKESINFNLNYLQKLTQLKPAEYTFKKELESKLNLPQNLQHGIIADELEQIFPELVTEIVHPAQYDENDVQIAEEMKYKGINYIGLIPIMIESIKEQQLQIETLTADKIKSKDENEQLRNDLNDIKSKISTLDQVLKQCCFSEYSKATDIENKQSSSNTETPVLFGYLEQNVPNPFNSSTVIKYSVGNAKEAVINILSSSQKLIKSYPVSVIANGSLTISARTISAGNYIYQLVADGKVIDSRIMVIVR